MLLKSHCYLPASMFHTFTHTPHALVFDVEHKHTQNTTSHVHTRASRNAGTCELALRFGAPPFSVLDGRRGYWQKRRKDYWENLYGLRSELGRSDNLLGLKGVLGNVRGTSVRAPTLRCGRAAEVGDGVGQLRRSVAVGQGKAEERCGEMRGK